MGKLLKEIKNVPKSRMGPKSQINDVFDSLPLEDAKDLVDAIFDNSVPVPAIVEVLKNRGFSISPTIITKLRHGKSLPPDKKYFR